MVLHEDHSVDHCCGWCLRGIHVLPDEAEEFEVLIICLQGTENKVSVVNILRKNADCFLLDETPCHIDGRSDLPGAAALGSTFASSQRGGVFPAFRISAQTRKKLLVLIPWKTELQSNRGTRTWVSYLSVDEDMPEGGNNKPDKMDLHVSWSCNFGRRLVGLIPVLEGLLAIDLAISLRGVMTEDLQLRGVEILVAQYRRLHEDRSKWSTQLGRGKFDHF
jgi:hypothetical protein